jgi:hypothetical protein
MARHLRQLRPAREVDGEAGAEDEEIAAKLPRGVAMRMASPSIPSASTGAPGWTWKPDGRRSGPSSPAAAAG